jgi:hypothetical protein
MRLKQNHSSSESDLYQASPVEIRHFPKRAARREPRRRKTRVSAVWSDTPVKITLKAKVEEPAEPVKYQKLFSGSQDRPRKSKKLRKNVRRVGSSREKDEYFCTECAKLYSMFRAPTKWFQCITCNKWAHDRCASFSDCYICSNYDSDDDIDDFNLVG